LKKLLLSGKDAIEAGSKPFEDGVGNRLKLALYVVFPIEGRSKVLDRLGAAGRDAGSDQPSRRRQKLCGLHVRRKVIDILRNRFAESFFVN
jgi:hypothetical protein